MCYCHINVNVRWFFHHCCQQSINAKDAKNDKGNEEEEEEDRVLIANDFIAVQNFETNKTNNIQTQGFLLWFLYHCFVMILYFMCCFTCDNDDFNSSARAFAATATMVTVTVMVSMIITTQYHVMGVVMAVNGMDALPFHSRGIQLITIIFTTAKPKQ